jgi:hypothetical protein
VIQSDKWSHSDTFWCTVFAILTLSVLVWIMLGQWTYGIGACFVSSFSFVIGNRLGEVTKKGGEK